MKKLENKFNEISKGVSLTENEKSAMREYLLEYQALKPYRGVESPFVHPTFANFLAWKPMPVLVALVLFFTGSGISIAAQNALPGDILYSVKVSVNEKVAGVFALSDAARASYETELADTRLTEAEQLAAKGQLSEDSAASLEANFTAHTQAAKNHIAKIQTSDENTAQVELNTLTAVLATHEKILRKDKEGGTIAAAVHAETAALADEGDTNGGDHPAVAATLAAPVRTAAALAPEATTATSTATTTTSAKASWRAKFAPERMPFNRASTTRAIIKAIIDSPDEGN